MKKTPNIELRTSNSECGSAVLRLDVGLRLVERSGSERCWPPARRALRLGEMLDVGRLPPR